MIRIRTRPRLLNLVVLTSALVVCSGVAHAQRARPEAQDLGRVVPDQAFYIAHKTADPDLAFLDEYAYEILDVIQKAQFDELIIETLQAGGMQADAGNDLRALRDLVVGLVRRVDWAALSRNESVFAMDMRPMLPWLPGGFPSMLFAFSPDPADVANLERSLGSLMATVAAIAPDALAFETGEVDEEGLREYHLLWGKLPIVQLAIRDSEVLLAAGNDLFRSAVGRLKGHGTALIDTERFVEAFGGLSREASTTKFFDVGRMIDDIESQVIPYLPHYEQVREAVQEGFELGRVVETVAWSRHAEGYTVVDESWVRFDRRAVQNEHPLFQACCKPPTRELLDYVPADATSFNMMRGVDLVPLYRYARDRYEYYAPKEESEEVLVAFDAAQAILDIDFEDDILSLMGSDSITITVPAEDPSPMRPEHFVSLVKVGNPESARGLIRRVENVYDACVPWLMQRIKEREPNIYLPNIKLEKARGTFPGLRKMSMSMRLPGIAIPMPDMTYGMVGDLLVFTSSTDALAYVLEVGMGDADGIDEHPALNGDRLPEGPMVSASLMPYSSRMEELRQGFQMATTFVTLGLDMAAKSNPKPEVRTMVKGLSGLMPRIAAIIQHVDFLEDGVSYSQVRDEGRALYARTTTRYRAPEDRPHFPRR